MLKIVAALMLVLPSAGLASTPATGDPASADDKVTCKKSLETGSWVKGRKVCKTASQWRELAANAQNDIEKFRYPNGWSPCADGGTSAGARYDPSMPRIGC